MYNVGHNEANMDFLKEIDETELKKIHDFYMEVESLNQTVEHIEKTYSENVNRHALSMRFKEHNLRVQPPNGRRAADFFRVINRYQSPESQLAANILEQSLKDVKKYRDGKTSKINFISACFFFASELYRDILTILNNGYQDINDDLLPEGLSEAVIRAGASLYKDQYSHWIAS